MKNNESQQSSGGWCWFFVKVKFLSATRHGTQPFSRSPLREPLAHCHLAATRHPAPRGSLLRRTSPRSASSNHHLRMDTRPAGDPPKPKTEGGFQGGVRGDQPNSASPDNGTGRSGVHLGSGPRGGEEEAGGPHRRGW